MAYIGNNLNNDVSINQYEYTATAGQTTFYCTYEKGVDVYINGMLLSKTDYAAVDGVSVILNVACTAGQLVTINCFKSQMFGRSTTSRQTYTATASQTVFAIQYDIGFIDVYRNGLKLSTSDFVASNGTTVVLNNACSLNDVVDIVAYGTFDVANVYSKNDTDVLLNAKVNKISSTDNAVVRFDGTTGQVQNSSVVIDDSGNVQTSGNGHKSIMTKTTENGYNADLIAESTTGRAGIRLKATAGNYWNIGEIGTGNFVICNNANGNMATNERMRIDSAGRVTMPYQPAFFVRFSNGGLTLSGGYQIFDSILVNTGSNYNASNGRFTAPIAGRYLISAQTQHWGGTSASNYCDIYVNGSLFRGARMESPATSNYQTNSSCVVMYLNIGDYVSFFCNGTSVFWSDHTSFSGYLIG